MERVQIYLDNTIRTLLSDYAENNHCSMSRAANNVIFAYLTDNRSLDQLQKESKQQFLRLMNVINQIFFCVYDPTKTRIPSESPEECLAQIKKSIAENTALVNRLVLD